MKRVTGAGVEDIHADPHLMEKCARDVNKYCDHALSKEGKGTERSSFPINDQTFVVKNLRSNI